MNNTPAGTTFERVKASIVDMLGCRPEEVNSTATFHGDLATDSLDDIGLVMDWEEIFDIEIADEEAAQLATVQQAVDLIDRKLAEKSAR